MKTKKIGQIGIGWIGGNYANDFERRGYEVIRYDITEQYKDNKEKIKDCDIVFVAVPTPSTFEKGFDDSILINAIKATKENQIVVIKSTIQVGTTDKIQKLFPDRYILHSPEFLTEKTAEYDTAKPDRNIIGFTEKSQRVAGEVMNVLPIAPYETIIPCKEAELIKYAGNIWFYYKVLVCNMIYDVAENNGLDYDLIKDVMSADRRIGRTHLDVIHQGGRGAGGHCFIKDLVAFKGMYVMNDKEGLDLIVAAEKYNQYLLGKTGKDTELLKGVYEKRN